MKWLDNWFRKKCQQALNQGVPDDIEVPVSGHRKQRLVANHNEINARGMNFTLYNAIGGYVVEMRRYDAKTDRHDNVLHIIPNDKELGESLTQIMTYELLKQ